MKYILLLLVPSFLFGCGTLDKLMYTPNKTSDVANTKTANRGEYKLHYYVEQLARQLFDTAKEFEAHRAVIVGAILPTDSLEKNKDVQMQALGYQLQESLSTLSVQAGLTVIEYRAMNSIVIEDGAGKVLSNNVSDLMSSVSADYFLTGTYTHTAQQDRVIVNIKLIEVGSKSIVAAATGYVPVNSLWDQNKIKMQNNSLYRGEY